MNQEVYDRIRETVLQVSLLKDEYQLAVERREYETVAAAKSAYYRHKHLLNEADVRHANAKLTFAQEQVLVATCQTFSAANQGLQPAEVGEVILKVWDITDVGLQLPSETSYRAHWETLQGSSEEEEQRKDARGGGALDRGSSGGARHSQLPRTCRHECGRGKV